MRSKLFIILMAVCAILNGCGQHNHSQEHDDEGASHIHVDGIKISPERQAVLGIITDTVEVGEFNEIIRTSGQIISSTGDEMTVVAKSEGIVNLSGLAEGSPVGKGARIATISSKGIGSGDKLAKARITYETAKKEYERDIQLSKDNIVSESHLDQSRLEYEYAKAEYEALAAGSGTSGGIIVTSPLSGFIKNLSVRSGDYVETGSPIATVSQNRKLRLRADVSEKYFSKISLIRDANFKTSYGDGTYRMKDLGGRLAGYGRAADGDFFIPVTFEFDNKGDFVPGSFVDVYLMTSLSKECLSIPLEAVVEDQGVHYVFVLDDDGDFLKREVSLGISDGERVPVFKGLEAGDVVVVKGAVHVKLAGVTAVPAGHTHNH